MRLGIIGAIVLGLGIWALKYSWWFVVETIAIRRMYRAKQTAEK
ncbi:MAG: hypothetical protein ACYSU5_24920 [Planctomycetota bacterium]|jgi:hypothetical protein